MILENRLTFAGRSVLDDPQDGCVGAALIVLTAGAQARLPSLGAHAIAGFDRAEALWADEPERAVS